MIVGKFTGWKPRSLIPMSRFYELLLKNKESNLREINLGKNTYEEELREIKEGKEAKLKVTNEKRRAKTRLNFDKIKFSEAYKSQWVDKLSHEDFKMCEHSDWFERVIELLPYGDDTNFVFDPELLKRLDVAR